MCPIVLTVSRTGTHPEEHPMSVLHTVHTDCNTRRAKEIAGAALHTYVGASQGGFYGTTIALPHEDARKVADELREHGYEVRVTRGPGS
jgi:hypothetical protein